MARHHRKALASLPHRVTRRRAADLPDVPVVAPDAAASSEAGPAVDQSRSMPQPDSVDDRIRRMIEAAYT
jgi:hypothetical protein